MFSENDWIAVDSSNIMAIAYSPLTLICGVRFHDPRMSYREGYYKDVPAEAFERWRDNPDEGSFGKHHHRHIKKFYDYTPVNYSPTKKRPSA